MKTGGANSALYLNAIKLPFFADFNAPEKYGLARAPHFQFIPMLVELSL